MFNNLSRSGWWQEPVPEALPCALGECALLQPPDFKSNCFSLFPLG